MVKRKIRIYARVKPNGRADITSVYSVDNEEQTGASLEFVVPKDLSDGFVNNKRENYKFRFQKVFDQNVKQEEIFETIARPVVDSVLGGYNGTIFAYGQTGSGKTFTITGGAERYTDRGIIPRTLAYMYQRFSQDNSMVYTTHVSYLEIYNEQGFDLLDPNQEASRLEDLPKVTIMEDPEQNIHLKNLSLQQSANEEEALNLLFLGDTNRMIAETPMNQASTRSHCIFTLHLCAREPGSATFRRSKLHLVDLAGSERVGKTGVGGHQFTEGKYINLSLHFLEQVIIALSERNRSHIPYRNSMMTSVLRDSLGGNCMTTMVATVSADKRNLDESISTCRFAQRVALIKNEALLNEELDPALLIVRMKREIQSLKEELSMVTGEQREDQLTPEEIHKLEEVVKVYLDDPDPEVTVALGVDMRKIHHCFYLLKVIIREKLSDGDERHDSQVRESESHNSPEPAHLTRLKEMLTQRDNEISILVGMLKREKKRAQDATAHLENIANNGHSVPSASALSVVSLPEAGSTGNLSTCHGRPASLYRRRAPELSMGKQEAFNVFRRDHEDSLTVEDNKAVLKQRFAEAKALGEHVNEARARVNELKKQLEVRRMQRAACGVSEGRTQVKEEEDPVEESLRREIEREKNIYKSAFGRLKAMKTEIEHLQLLLERAKVKLQKDFQEWWSQEEASNAQVSESGATAKCERSGQTGRDLQPSSHAAPVFSTARGLLDSTAPSAADLRNFIPKSSSTIMTAVPPWGGRPQEGRDTAFTPSSELRALSTTDLSSSPFPLTGDQQTDSDILAFIKARQNLLNRTGPAHGDAS